jgi:O-acetyl-ADP-ribose deacetylase (regulator of RNase III)
VNSFEIGDITVTVERGDITDQDVDGIVNAANNDLLLGAGVAGAIARRGGPAVQAECDRIGPISVGDAAITGGGNLTARHVLHAASMHLGGRTSPDALRSSMRRCFQLAAENALTSIAIPAVGTGVARLPLQECARVMADCVRESLHMHGHPTDVRFVLFDEAAEREFAGTFANSPVENS